MFKFALVLCVALVLVEPTEGIRFRRVRRVLNNVAEAVKQPACKVRLFLLIHKYKVNHVSLKLSSVAMASRTTLVVPVENGRLINYDSLKVYLLNIIYLRYIICYHLYIGSSWPLGVSCGDLIIIVEHWRQIIIWTLFQLLVSVGCKAAVETAATALGVASGGTGAAVVGIGVNQCKVHMGNCKRSVRDSVSLNRWFRMMT